MAQLSKQSTWAQFSFEKRRGNRYEHIEESEDSKGDLTEFLIITIWKRPRGGGWTGSIEGTFLPPYTQIRPESLSHDTKEDALEELMGCSRAVAKWYRESIPTRTRRRKTPGKRPAWLRVVK